MRGRRKKNSIIENFVLHQRSMEKIECLEAPARQRKAGARPPGAGAHAPWRRGQQVV